MSSKNVFLIILILVLFLLLLVYISNLPTSKANTANKVNNKTSKNINSENNKKQESFQSEYIIPQEKLAVIQGSQVPQTPTQPVGSFDNDPSGAPIDGDPNSPTQLFTFAFNKASPECCMDSEFSTSQGCVCLTDKQKNWFSQRGNNSGTPKCHGSSEF